VAIGVRLDHGAHRSAHPAADIFIVVPQGIEIDLGPAVLFKTGCIQTQPPRYLRDACFWPYTILLYHRPVCLRSAPPHRIQPENTVKENVRKQEKTRENKSYTGINKKMVPKPLTCPPGSDIITLALKNVPTDVPDTPCGP
jgi:hypothetical protein